MVTETHSLFSFFTAYFCMVDGYALLLFSSPILCVGTFASIDKKLSGVINHNFVLANEEPRGAWRILAESGFCGGNAEQTALRADHIFGGNLNSEFWRCLLDKVRTFFETNPDEE